MSQTAEISRQCRWCGQFAEEWRELKGPGWACHYCGHSQTFGPCPCCGSLASATFIDAGMQRLAENARVELRRGVRRA